MKTIKLFCLSSLLFFSVPTTALAADGATIVFDSGLAVFIRNGYKQIVDGLRKYSRGSEQQYVEINVDGSSFFVNLEEVTVVCRDQCNNLTIIRPKK